jgi:hypothetical protein
MVSDDRAENYESDSDQNSDCYAQGDEGSGSRAARFERSSDPSLAPHGSLPVPDTKRGTDDEANLKIHSMPG